MAFAILSMKILRGSWRRHMWLYLHDINSLVAFLQENKYLNGKKFCFIFCRYFVVTVVCQYQIFGISVCTHLHTCLLYNLLHCWFACRIFITRSLWRISKLTCLLHSLVCVTILCNLWIKIVCTHQPWSHLYTWGSTARKLFHQKNIYRGLTARGLVYKGSTARRLTYRGLTARRLVYRGLTARTGLWIQVSSWQMPSWLLTYSHVRTTKNCWPTIRPKMTGIRLWRIFSDTNLG